MEDPKQVTLSILKQREAHAYYRAFLWRMTYLLTKSRRVHRRMVAANAEWLVRRMVLDSHLSGSSKTA